MDKLLKAIKIGFEVIAHLELAAQMGGPLPFELKTEWRGKRLLTTGETRLRGAGE